MFKDLLFMLFTFLGLFTLTLKAFFWGAALLFLVIILRLVFDVLLAVKHCVGEKNYGDRSN